MKQSFFKRFFKYLKFCNQGGYTNLTIAQISYPELLKGKKIIITGGSEGIGKALAMKFLSVGAEVLITGRTLEKLEAAKKDINNEKLYVMQWDVADINEKHFDDAIKQLGGLDVFVNNAAFLSWKSNDIDFFDNTINTNVRAVYYLCRRVCEYYKTNNGFKGGKILNISSVNSFESDTHPYYISKSAVNAITRAFAKEYIDSNIIVNGIAPGVCASSINYCDVERNAYYENSKNHRITTPEELAEIALFLIGDAANGIVGQTIICDGGKLL